MILEKISRAIKNETGVDIRDYKLKSCRKRHIVDAKRIYGLITRRTTLYSLEVIGKYIYKDHCSIMHYVRTGRDLLKNNSDFEDLYYRCLKNVNNTPYIDVIRDAYHYHLKKSNEYLQELNELLLKPDETILKQHNNEVR